MYVVINKFLVQSKHHKGFIKETRTVWFNSYKKSKGFVKAMIIKSRKNPNEFLTIDIWKSKKHADIFFSENIDKLQKASDIPKRYIQRKSYNSIS